MKDSKYGSGMLGTVFFRSGTFESAKAVYDTVNKIITVKLENTGSSAYAKVRIDGENGIKFTNAAVGDGINPDTAVKVSSNGSYVTFNGTNLLGAGKSGYLYLKYEGEIDPDKLPVIVKLYRSGAEARVYTAVFDASAGGEDMGDPKFHESETTTAEATEAETAQAETTAEPPLDTTSAEQMTEPAPENKGCGGFAHSGIAIAALGAAVLKKKKKK